MESGVTWMMKPSFPLCPEKQYENKPVPAIYFVVVFIFVLLLFFEPSCKTKTQGQRNITILSILKEDQMATKEEELRRPEDEDEHFHTQLACFPSPAALVL